MKESTYDKKIAAIIKKANADTSIRSSAPKMTVVPKEKRFTIDKPMKAKAKRIVRKVAKKVKKKAKSTVKRKKRALPRKGVHSNGVGVGK